jgi:hypothetical protein
MISMNVKSLVITWILLPWLSGPSMAAGAAGRKAKLKEEFNTATGRDALDIRLIQKPDTGYPVRAG